MALNIENIIAEIKEASILELNDLVKAIEEEFGVTAAAPVAVVLKKLKLLLMVHLLTLKKALQLRKLKKSKLNLKKLELQLLLNNRVTTQVG